MPFLWQDTCRQKLSRILLAESPGSLREALGFERADRDQQDIIWVFNNIYFCHSCWTFVKRLYLSFLNIPAVCPWEQLIEYLIKH